MDHKGLFAKRYDEVPGLFYFDASHFPGLRKEDRSFRNGKGARIAAYSYRYGAVPSRKPFLLFLHGLGGGHLSYSKEIAFFAKEGYEVLSFDAMGCMASEGQEIGGFHQELCDAIAFLKAIEGDPRYANRPLYLCGHSMGGYTALLLMEARARAAKICCFAPIVFEEAFYEAISRNAEDAKSIKAEEDALYPEYRGMDGLKSLQNHPEVPCLIFASCDDPIALYAKQAGVLEAHHLPNVRIRMAEGRGHNPEYSASSVARLTAYLGKIAAISDPKILKAMAVQEDWDELYALDETSMRQAAAFLEE